MIVSETIPIISGSTFLILKGRITLLFNSKVDNQYATDPRVIADVFANHFASTFNANYQSIIPPDLKPLTFYPLLLSLQLK
jgi:hypothetical protein